MKYSPPGSDVNAIKIVFDRIPDIVERDFLVASMIYWQPLFDSYVMEGEVVITIEIAGVKPRDFTVYAGRNYMIIDGVRQSPVLVAKEHCKFHNIEIPYGRFYLKIDFPMSVQAKKCQHSLNYGILTLRFPLEKEVIIPIQDG